MASFRANSQNNQLYDSKIYCNVLSGQCSIVNLFYLCFMINQHERVNEPDLEKTCLTVYEDN